MRVYSQALACDGHAPGAVLLFLDEQRFLFDVPEGTQRYCTECKLKLMKVKGIFLTRVHPDHMLGLPGLLLTLREQERTKLAEDGQKGIKDAMKAGTLHRQYAAVRAEADMMGVAGPAALGKVMGSMRPFLKCHGFYKVNEVDEAAAPRPGTVVYKSTLAPYFTVRAVNINGAVSYCVDIPEQPGRFLPEKAAALGVKGKKRAQLVKGEKVESDTQPGRWVEPHEVTAPNTPPMAIVMIASPLCDSIRAFVGDDEKTLVKAVYHLTPVAQQTAAYQHAYAAFFAPMLAKAGGGVEHQWFAKAMGHTVFHSSALQHDRLSVIAPELFPPERKGWDAAAAGDDGSALAAPVQYMRELQAYNIFGGQHTKGGSLSDPRACLDLAAGRAGWPAFFKEEYDNNNNNNNNNNDAASTPPTADAGTSKSYPKVVTLGTGGMMPSKYRNVTSVYVAPRPGCHILLDCGEGTLGQLRRCADADAVLRDLSCIWISHIHADHHVGLATLLHRRAARNPGLPRLAVVGPRDLEPYLATLQSLVDLNYTFQPCRQGVADVADGVTLASISVQHCADAYGCVIEGPGWKVVNSGDTRPCAALVDAGRDCDVLLHEATFEDDKMEDAVSKRHSTVSEALDIAAKMNAKQTILTHFSQRYPKLPPPMTVAEGGEADGKSVALAFDLMQLTTSSGPALRRMNDGLSKLNAYYEAVEAEKQRVADAITHERVRKEEEAKQIREKRRLEREAKQREEGALRRGAKRRKNNDGTAAEPAAAPSAAAPADLPTTSPAGAGK